VSRESESLRVIRKTSDVPLTRGPMMNAAQIATELYHGQVDPKWVLANVPHKMKFGHRTVLWYEQDVIAFIESVRAA
jgi:hypothetical protein